MSNFKVKDEALFMSIREKLDYLAASASALNELKEHYSTLSKEIEAIDRKRDEDICGIVDQQSKDLHKNRSIGESMIRIFKKDFNGKAILLSEGKNTSVVFVSGERISILPVAAVVDSSDSLSADQSSSDILDGLTGISKHKTLSSLALQAVNDIGDIQAPINKLESLDAKTALKDVFGITNIIPTFHYFESEIIRLGVSDNITVEQDSIESVYASLLLDAILQILKSPNFPLSP